MVCNDPKRGTLELSEKSIRLQIGWGGVEGASVPNNMADRVNPDVERGEMGAIQQLWDGSKPVALVIKTRILTLCLRGNRLCVTKCVCVDRDFATEFNEISTSCNET